MRKSIFVVAAMIVGSYSQAQQDTTVKTLDDVVITANKYPNKTSLTGKVLTVVTREQIEKSGGKTLAQLLTEQAAVYINGANSNAGKDKSVFVRGARIDYSLITIDGVPLYDPSGIGSNFDIRNIPLDNIERIEILKGSQSTLYGSDAIAAVINIITRKSGNKKIGGYGNISYGSYNTFNAQAGLNGRNGKADYNISYTYFDTKGINEATDTTKNNPVKPDKDGYTQNSFYANLGIQLNDQSRIQPYLRYTDIRGGIDQGAFTDELDFSFSQKNLQAGFRNENKIGKLKLNLIYNYSNTERTYTDDSTLSQNGFAKYSYGKYKANEHFAEAYIFYPVSNLVKLTSGIDYRNSNTSQDYLSLSFFGPYKSSLGKDSLKQNQLGVYAALNLNTAKGFNAEIGGRYNHHSAYGSNFVFNINPSYLLNDQWKIFANLSSGYKTPTLYQLYSEYGNKQLKPESAITTEAGLQFFSRNRQTMARLTYFNRQVKEVIAFFYNASTFQSYYINQDKQKDNGLEAEAEFSIGKNTTLKLFYSYVDGEVTTRNGSKDTSYNNLIRRPKNSFGLNIGSRISKQFYVSANLNAFGKRYDISYDAFYNQVQVELKSYWLADLYAEYAFFNNKLKVFANLRNLFNEKYNEVYGYNTMRFNGYGGIRFNF